MPSPANTDALQRGADASHQPTAERSMSPFSRELLSLSAMVLVAYGTIAGIKVSRLFAWRYASDLFTYDQVLQETLRGHWGLEFTYGNLFGGHAYLFLLPLLPLKLLLGRNMVVLLVLLAPLVCAASSVVLFVALRRVSGRMPAWSGTVLFVIGFGAARGLSEADYGFHPDTFSGYLLTASAAVLGWYWHDRERGAPTRRTALLFWATFAGFLLLKEETAALGAVFMLVVWTIRRDGLHLAALLVACGVAGFDLLLLTLNTTEWVRTDHYLVESIRQDLFRHGLLNTLVTGRGHLWLLLFGFGQLFLVTCLLSARLNTFALALYATALAKTGLNLAVREADPTSWHHLPVFTLLVGAIVLQQSEALASPSRPRRAGAHAFTVALLLSFAVGFVRTEAPFIAETVTPPGQLVGPGAAARRRQCLEEIKRQIDRQKVVAIPGFSAIDWTDGYRMAFFPRGVFWSPRGIADYLIEDRIFSSPDLTDYMENGGSSEFAMATENEYFVLFKREAIDSRLAAGRRRFAAEFGERAIGGPEEYPSIKIPVWRERPPDPVLR